jgi:ABC-2 type transport system ATP-binding protein
MPPSGPELLRLEGVTRRYGARVALDDVSFVVERGLCALCGGNGAGKTTLLRVIVGYLDADGGRVVLPPGARLGYLPEGAPMPPELTVAEYVRHRASLSAVRLDVGETLALSNIAGRAGDPIGKLSKGLRQRAALAGVLVADPTILILDEPASGLDEEQRTELRATLRSLSETRTILWSTHELSDVEAAADHVLLLADGKLVASGTVASLKSQADLPRAPLRDAIAALTSPEYLSRRLRGVAPPGSRSPAALSKSERSEDASKGRAGSRRDGGDS